MDMLARLQKRPRIFVLDTGRLHEETYEVMQKCRQRYGVEFDVSFPTRFLFKTSFRSKGPASFFASVPDRKGVLHYPKGRAAPPSPLRPTSMGSRAFVESKL